MRPFARAGSRDERLPRRDDGRGQHTRLPGTRRQTGTPTLLPSRRAAAVGSRGHGVEINESFGWCRAHRGREQRSTSCAVRSGAPVRFVCGRRSWRASRNPKPAGLAAGRAAFQSRIPKLKMPLAPPSIEPASNRGAQITTGHAGIVGRGRSAPRHVGGSWAERPEGRLTRPPTLIGHITPRSSYRAKLSPLRTPQAPSCNQPQFYRGDRI